MTIRKYIFKITFLAIFVTLVAFGLIDYILTLISELTYRLDGGYQSIEAFSFVTLTTPGRLYFYFPYICLIGVLFAFGQLADKRELVILKSSGMTKSQIIRITLAGSFAWLIIAFSIGESIAPKLDQTGYELRNIAASSEDSSRYDVWHRDQNYFYFLALLERMEPLKTVSLLA